MDNYQANRESLFGPGSRVSWPLAQSEEDLPVSYGETRLVLLPVEPDRVFCYWDFSFGRLLDRNTEQEALAAKLGIPRSGLALHLRLWRLPVASLAWQWTIPISDRSIYLDCPWQDGSFAAEIGFVNAGGDFLALVRSNTIGLGPVEVLATIDQKDQPAARPDLEKAENQEPQPAPSTWFHGDAEARHRLAGSSPVCLQVENIAVASFPVHVSDITRECDERFVSGLSSLPTWTDQENSG